MMDELTGISRLGLVNYQMNLQSIAFSENPRSLQKYDDLGKKLDHKGLKTLQAL